VKFPTGGDEIIFSKPASLLAGFGEIPKPTVKSGWEKMEVPQTFKKAGFERLLSVSAFYSPSSHKLGGVYF